MRFAIFSNSFAPDWLIISISHLTLLSSLRLKMLTKSICSHLLTTTPTSPGELKTQEFDGKLSPSEVKGCVAALTFIVLSITRVHSSTFHGDDVRPLDGTVVTNELHQLGLTKEAAEGFSHMYDEFKTKLVTWNVDTMSVGPSRLFSTDWRLIYGLAGGGYTTGGSTTSAPSPSSSNVLDVQLSFKKNDNSRINFSMSLEKFDELKMELENVQSIIEKEEAKK
ncbi:hypothetical protein TrLO_g12591 [Triparma laevis f. longispina]|uniref:COMM domain-containing protein n=1 Tax=Triparma laevis f. longispina TaxID=1714387 RepID=A0A9W6Z9D1_9STRA|nr:hypothetical protein TrLO_g12591 [Triparma laevis f. longispina]